MGFRSCSETHYALRIEKEMKYMCCSATAISFLFLCSGRRANCILYGIMYSLACVTKVTVVDLKFEKKGRKTAAFFD